MFNYVEACKQARVAYFEVALSIFPMFIVSSLKYMRIYFASYDSGNLKYRLGVLFALKRVSELWLRYTSVMKRCVPSLFLIASIEFVLGLDVFAEFVELGDIDVVAILELGQPVSRDLDAHGLGRADHRDANSPEWHPDVLGVHALHFCDVEYFL